jgi:hypothetical protein
LIRNELIDEAAAEFDLIDVIEIDISSVKSHVNEIDE